MKMITEFLLILALMMFSTPFFTLGCANSDEDDNDSENTIEMDDDDDSDPEAPANAAILKECDVLAGFNLQRDFQGRIGFITSIKIGALSLQSDFTLTEPLGFSSIDVVGVISSASWEGGVAQPLSISAQVSMKNKQTISQFVHGDLADTNVFISFDVYEYDRRSKTWYLSFYTNDVELEGVIAKDGGALSIVVEDAPNEDVMTPQNYQFSIDIDPVEKSQEIHFAVSPSMKIVKAWGVVLSK